MRNTFYKCFLSVGNFAVHQNVSWWRRQTSADIFVCIFSFLFQRNFFHCQGWSIGVAKSSYWYYRSIKFHLPLNGALFSVSWGLCWKLEGKKRNQWFVHIYHLYLYILDCLGKWDTLCIQKLDNYMSCCSNCVCNVGGTWTLKMHLVEKAHPPGSYTLWLCTSID